MLEEAISWQTSKGNFLNNFFKFWNAVRTYSRLYKKSKK